MNNGRITEADIKSLFDTIAIYYQGLLRIGSNNNIFIEGSCIGKIEVNGSHNNNNLINSWEILQKLITELGDEKYQAIIFLMETSDKILSDSSRETLNLLIKRELRL